MVGVDGSVPMYFFTVPLAKAPINLPPKPEFLNRIDEVILFTPLTRQDLKKIVLIQFDRIKEIALRQRINLTISEAAIQWFANAGFDPAFGARPLKRVMQRKITNRISALILSGEIGEGDEVAIDMVEGELSITKAVA